MFDILNLANQLYRSKSTYPESPQYGKIDFSKNQIFNLVKQKQEHLFQAIKSYKKVIEKDLVYKKD